MKFRRHDAKGRSAGRLTPAAAKAGRIEGQFVPMLREVLESPGWRRLSLAARRTLDRIVLEHMAHGGVENGRLIVPSRALIAAGISASSVTPALDELEGAGFIVPTCPRLYRSKVTWRITFLPSLLDDGKGLAAPGHEWKNRIPATKTGGTLPLKQVADRRRNRDMSRPTIAPEAAEMLDFAGSPSATETGGTLYISGGKGAKTQLRDTRTGKRITEIGTPADPSQASIHRRASLVLAAAGGGRRLAEASGLDRTLISKFGRGERVLSEVQVRKLEAGLATLEGDPPPVEKGAENAA